MAWYAKLAAWQESWIHPDVHGTRPGHETLQAAWPVQSRIEAAAIKNENRSAAILDYTKFFDLFDVDFEMQKLVYMGYPEDLAKIQAAFSLTLRDTLR